MQIYKDYNWNSSYRHFPVIRVLQPKIVAFSQVEVDTDQVKKHFPRRTLLQEKNSRGEAMLD